MTRPTAGVSKLARKTTELGECPRLRYRNNAYHELVDVKILRRLLSVVARVRLIICVRLERRVFERTSVSQARTLVHSNNNNAPWWHACLHSTSSAASPPPLEKLIVDSPFVFQVARPGAHYLAN